MNEEQKHHWIEVDVLSLRGPTAQSISAETMVKHHWCRHHTSSLFPSLHCLVSGDRSWCAVTSLESFPTLRTPPPTSSSTECSLNSLWARFKAPNVATLMKWYDFYVNDHRWCETDWNTLQLGVFYGIDPQFYDLDQATCKIQAVFQKNAPRMKVPKFRLVYCSPKVRALRGSNRTIRTKAYTIETLRKDRDKLTRILKHAYNDDGTFVPFQMRSRHPEAFKKMIRA